MSDYNGERRESPHVTISYRDDEDDDKNVHPHTHLLSSTISASQPAVPAKRRSCFRRIVLFIAMIAMGIGIFELAFHGKEAESLQVAKQKVVELQQKLGQKVKSSYGKMMATISQLPTTPSPKGEAGKTQTKEGEAELDTIKSKSVIVLKTGASVLFDRLPIQLLQAQQVIHPQVHLTGQLNYSGPTYLIYSDADIQVGLFAVRDALTNVSSFVRNDKAFSTQYKQLHTLLSSGDDFKASSFRDGWTLDKWKFLYMWEDAFHRNPDADWYIGYEADTYVLWDSLFKFLLTQDAGKEQLYGCPSILVRNQELFANGGCPYVISGALMRATYGKDPHFASKFDKEVKVSCCGDAELSIALRHSGSAVIRNLANAGARFQGERPREILFDKDNWCQPVLNFHHLKTEEVSWLSQVEKSIREQKSANQTILYSDIFDHILPHILTVALEGLSKESNETDTVELNPTQDDWEAFGSADKGVKQGRRTEDVKDCKKQCLDSKGCTSWFWIKVTEQDPDGDCYLMHGAVKIGKSYEGTGLRTSGWIDATSKPHTDNNDDDPSILFNFGGEAWLALLEIGVKVKLRPLDVAIMTSNKYERYTILDDDDEGVRWAVGGFMRVSVLQKHPSAHSQKNAKLHLPLSSSM
ncbi:hypothetical protein NDA17_001061 [Ustilago hordei]|nr:hypothetical protein NDA17_001061 [Ustilago hordei]